MTKDLTTDSLKLLLKLLATDENEAGFAYSKLRDSLIRFFELKCDFLPDEAADITIDRVASKLSEGAIVDDISKYSFGVARFVALERFRTAQKEKLAADGYYERNETNSAEEEEHLLQMKECLGCLSVDERDLLMGYFADLPYRILVEQRQRLADENGLSVNQFRVRIFRLRKRLEDCIRKKKKHKK